MGPPVRPVDLSDADLYETFRDRGLTHEQAMLHVERRRRANQPPSEALAPEGPTKAEAMLGSATQAATSGFADEILGNLIAAHRGWNPPGGTFTGDRDAATQMLRDQINGSRVAHPLAALAGQATGSFVNPINRVLGPASANMGPKATGTLYGAVLGGAQGAGETTGGLKDRAIGAVGGGVIGGATGFAMGWLAGKAGPPAAQFWRNIRGAFVKAERAVQRTPGFMDLPAEAQAQAKEAANRAALARQGAEPSVIDRIMEVWRGRGGKLPNRPPAQPTVETPIAVRPGETLTQTSPRGFEVTGFRETPPVPSSPTIAELLGVTTRNPDLGKGTTLPYYPRGGQASQAMSPGPVTSQVPTAPNGQIQVFVDFLKGAPPAEIPDRLSTLRALGLKLDAQTEAQLTQMLTGTPR